MYDIVYSVCFILVDGKCWKNQPSYYLGCLEQWLKKHENDTVIIYVHENSSNENRNCRITKKKLQKYIY